MKVEVFAGEKRVLVKLIEEEIKSNVTESGIILEEEKTNKAKIKKGEIVAYPDPEIELGIGIGDIIHFEEYHGRKIFIQGKEYFSVETDKILAFETTFNMKDLESLSYEV